MLFGHFNLAILLFVKCFASTMSLFSRQFWVNVKEIQTKRKRNNKMQNAWIPIQDSRIQKKLKTIIFYVQNLNVKNFVRLFDSWSSVWMPFEYWIRFHKQSSLIDSGAIWISEQYSGSSSINLSWYRSMYWSDWEKALRFLCGGFNRTLSKYVTGFPYETWELCFISIRESEPHWQWNVWIG